MERIRELVKRKDVDYIEIRSEEGVKTDIVIRGKTVETVKQGRFIGGNVRVLVGGVWGFVYFTNLDNLGEKVNETIEQAETLKGLVKEKSGLGFSPSLGKFIKADIKNDPYDVPLSEKVKLFNHYSDVALSLGRNIVSTVVSYSDTKKKVYFANSEGTYIEKELLDIGGYIVPVASNGKTLQRTIMPFGSSSDYSVTGNLDEKIKERAELAEKLLTAEKMMGGEYPVIVDPHLGGVFIHEAFGHLSEADFIYEDERMRSIMKIGNKIGSDILNVFDTGDIPGLRGALRYDDEGVEAKKVYLIKEGILSGHLHSRETAYKMKEEPTGNGRAINYKFPPIPRMRTTCIEKGTDKFENFVKDIKKGVYAKGSFGGQTNGELFTFVSEEAYLIENGKITKLLKDVSLSGNVFETLKNIVGVGEDFEIRDTGGGCGKNGQFPLPVSHGAPHIYIKKAIIGGK